MAPSHLPIFLLLITTMLFSFGALLAAAGIAHAHAFPPLAVQDQLHIDYASALDDVKVPVVLGVMSRCPDAMLCEAVFNRVLERVGSKVNISLTFVAK